MYISRANDNSRLDKNKFIERMFGRTKKLKRHIVADKYKIVLAFEHGGHKYYQFENVFDISTGRGLQAMIIYEEFKMRCDREYLEKHIKAVNKILSNPKTINIVTLATIHKNLEERLNLAPFPDHIYKLASVLFFDETESPFAYDMKYNNQKVSGWRADEEILPFLVQQPLKALMPFLDTPKETLQTYFKVSDVIEKMNQTNLSEVLSKQV